MIQIFKKILNKILGLANLKLINKNESGIIDKRSVASFQKKHENYKLYFEGLNKSKNNQSDNFWKQSRFLDLMNLVEMVLKRDDIKDFAEVGCWKGHSSFFISKLIVKHKKKIKLHIFDSFEGLSEISIKDPNINKFDKKKIKQIRSQFISDEQFVKGEVLKEFDFIEVYKGWVPKKFNMVDDLRFSFVHIDVDLYEPTLKSLEFFFPRLENGGVIVCDDYNSMDFNGSKLAWDEFFSDKKVNFKFAPSLGGSFVIK